MSGLAGFGTALMALGIWLYVLPPALAVPLVLICSVSRADFDVAVDVAGSRFQLAWPFVVGGLAGMPLGTLLVSRADPQIFKLSVGVMLLAFPTALYFVRSPMAFRFGGRAADGRNRVCWRHPGRACRSVRSASDLVGEHTRLDQGSAARRFPAL